MRDNTNFTEGSHGNDDSSWTGDWRQEGEVSRADYGEPRRKHFQKQWDMSGSAHAEPYLSWPIMYWEVFSGDWEIPEHRCLQRPAIFVFNERYTI